MELHERLIAWSGKLMDEWLRQPFRYTSNVDGISRTVASWLLVTHLFNHQTHHRGQLTSLLSQLGHDIGTTDPPFMPGVAD